MIIIDKFSIKIVNKIKWVIEKKNNDKGKKIIEKIKRQNKAEGKRWSFLSSHISVISRPFLNFKVLYPYSHLCHFQIP